MCICSRRRDTHFSRPPSPFPLTDRHCFCEMFEFCIYFPVDAGGEDRKGGREGGRVRMIDQRLGLDAIREKEEKRLMLVRFYKHFFLYCLLCLFLPSFYRVLFTFKLLSSAPQVFERYMPVSNPWPWPPRSFGADARRESYVWNSGRGDQEGKLSELLR